MTANVEIITSNKENVFLVSNKALRFYMEDENGQKQRYSDKGIWVLENNQPRRISIKTGIYDDDKTEVISEDLHEGMDIILEKLSSKDKNARAMRMRMPR